MDTEVASNPEKEVAPVESQQPEAEAPEVEEDAPDTPDDGDDNGEDDGDGDEVEEVELNFGGDKLRVPKGAIPDDVVAKLGDFSKNLEAGYTKKFQAVAEQQKSLQAREIAVEKLTGLSDDLLDTFSHGKQLKREIEQLSRYDLNALWQSNPDQARRLSDTLAQKQQEFQSVVATVAQKENALTQTQSAEVERRKAEGKSIISRQVKDFETKHLPEVIQYATTVLGIPKEAAANDWPLNPAMTMAVYKAAQYDKLQATPIAKPRPSPQAAPVVPMKGKGGTSAPRDPSKMSPAQMAKHLGLTG